MPMLSPYVWAIHAPPDAVRCVTVDEATAAVRTGQRVVLDDYVTAIRTLIALGATADEATYLAEVARKQPQHQDSYLP
jgi:hypothetical protein